MRLNSLKSFVLVLTFLSFVMPSFAVASSEEIQDEEFNPQDMITHHVLDAHEFHIIDWNNHPITLPLPIILWTDNGLTTFMSSAFEHDDSGKVIVERNGGRFVKLHEKIYQLDAGASSVSMDAEHHPTNASKPWDVSITRNVFMMWISVLAVHLAIPDYFHASLSALDSLCIGALHGSLELSTISLS